MLDECKKTLNLINCLDCKFLHTQICPLKGEDAFDKISNMIRIGEDPDFSGFKNGNNKKIKVHPDPEPFIHHVDKFLSTETIDFIQQLETIAKHIESAQLPHYDENLAFLRSSLERIVGACRELETTIGADRELLKQAQTRFQEMISPWFDQSWIMRRARTRPRGYPGDFELLNAIYDGIPKSTGLGGYLELYFFQSMLIRGVRSRLDEILQFLVTQIKARKGPISVLNVGSGSCRELQHLGRLLSGGNIHITCIDHDQEALDWAQARLKQIGFPDNVVDFRNYNAMRMNRGARNIQLFGKFDLIYSVGLFDYLLDKTLIGILKGLRETLNEGGVICTSFKDAERYDKTEPQWLVDWFFVQRNEQDCRRIFHSAGFSLEKQSLHRDRTGVMMIFRLEK